MLVELVIQQVKIEMYKTNGLTRRRGFTRASIGKAHVHEAEHSEGDGPLHGERCCKERENIISHINVL